MFSQSMRFSQFICSEPSYLSSGSSPSQQQQQQQTKSHQQRHHVIAREHERSHDRAKCRWLVLVRRFDLLTCALFPDSREFTSHVLRGRVAAIEQLKQEDRNVLLAAVEGGDGRMAGGDLVFSCLNAHKR